MFILKLFPCRLIETLFLLVLSILAMESADSIRSLYRHFLSGITPKSLNAFYYACSYAKADCFRFMNVTAAMALKIIPQNLTSQPVFQYHFSGTAPDLLRMAGKIPAESDRQ
jgi:putative component of membrane protein insertase Oxa1/YidC/SpoIIIJ protein YidD